MHRWLAPTRIAFAVLSSVALGFAGYHAATGVVGVVNYFNYFTNLSNMAAVVVLLFGGWAGLTGRRPVPGVVRGGVVLCMTITGIFYGLGLASYPEAVMIPWVGHVLQQLMPAVVLADWLADPPERRIRPVQAAGWMAFPLLYLAYTMVRGYLIDWYPYPFLDPALPNGYCRVAGASFLMTGAFVLVGAALLRAGNALADRRAARSGAAPTGRRAHARPA
ncbi:Pr6Pr family membrane protein [Kitasatospora sp. RG8]|uniref:Pr6Pr family membrane protein n=1 Tax=Kitasatospora sp. RG8 TaxID=2820815 RepID=UPI001AE0128B|nr:Pr6Pr family membrane protein [Kitasatospora sp. RG8]MBP0448163.1 Pr6Pr family membrane protein [Kitasatospora sp. RG8]